MTIVHLLIIDPQNSFMDTQGAELPVSGASADMKRLATLIDRVGTKLDDIHVTLDTHHLLHIAHPFMWVNSRGENPPVFTTITTADVRAGVWRAKNPAWQTLQAKPHFSAWVSPMSPAPTIRFMLFLMGLNSERKVSALAAAIGLAPSAMALSKIAFPSVPLSPTRPPIPAIGFTTKPILVDIGAS